MSADSAQLVRATCCACCVVSSNTCVPQLAPPWQVTLVYPEQHFMERLFTPEIAAFYEKFYADKGVIIKEGNTVTSLEGKGRRGGGCGTV